MLLIEITLYEKMSGTFKVNVEQRYLFNADFDGDAIAGDDDAVDRLGRMNRRELEAELGRAVRLFGRESEPTDRGYTRPMGREDFISKTLHTTAPGAVCAPDDYGGDYLHNIRMAREMREFARDRGRAGIRRYNIRRWMQLGQYELAEGVVAEVTGTWRDYWDRDYIDPRTAGYPRCAMLQCKIVGWTNSRALRKYLAIIADRADMTAVAEYIREQLA